MLGCWKDIVLISVGYARMMNVGMIFAGFTVRFLIQEFVMSFTDAVKEKLNAQIEL